MSRHARVGTGCTVGAGCYIGPSVIIGRNCQLEESVFVHESALVEDGVRIGAGAVLANGSTPLRETEQDDGFLVGVTVRSSAVIGAHAVCVAPATIGRWAQVAPGSVVTSDVTDFAAVAGAPARRTGWVGRAGARLVEEVDGSWVCPTTGERYVEQGGRLELAPLGG